MPTAHMRRADAGLIFGGIFPAYSPHLQVGTDPACAEQAPRVAKPNIHDRDGHVKEDQGLLHNVLVCISVSMLIGTPTICATFWYVAWQYDEFLAVFTEAIGLSFCPSGVLSHRGAMTRRCVVQTRNFGFLFSPTSLCFCPPISSTTRSGEERLQRRCNANNKAPSTQCRMEPSANRRGPVTPRSSSSIVLSRGHFPAELVRHFALTHPLARGDVDAQVFGLISATHACFDARSLEASLGEVSFPSILPLRGKMDDHIRLDQVRSHVTRSFNSVSLFAPS